MLGNLKIVRKISILLLLIFVISGILFSCVTRANISQQSSPENEVSQQLRNEITSKSLVLLETMNAVRDYTNLQISRKLPPELANKSFLQQSQPSYAAREIFEHLRKKENYRDYFYKEAALNPTNLRDKADSFEAELVERFRSDVKLKEISGDRTTNGEDFFYIARPLAVNQESCLQCHSTPAVAPKSLIETYGNTNGFGWKLKEIVGIQIIFVPTNR